MFLGFALGTAFGEIIRHTRRRRMILSCLQQTPHISVDVSLLLSRVSGYLFGWLVYSCEAKKRS